MDGVATLSVIGRGSCATNREIATRTGLSRNTAEKYLRAGKKRRATPAGELEQARSLCREALDLARDRATKSRKQRRNLRQIHTAFGLTKRWVSIRWKSRVRDRWNPGRAKYDADTTARGSEWKKTTASGCKS